MIEVDIPQDALNTYLSAKLDGFRTLQTIEKFKDGQSNPSYRLTADSGDYVLRRKPFGEILKSAHAVDREYRVMKALQDTTVPVPRAFHLCEDPAVIGSDFFIMSFVDGQTFWDPSLPTLDVNARKRCYKAINKTLAAIHSVDIDAVGLADFGRPGNYFARQSFRWIKQYRASETEVIPTMDAVIDWLENNMIEDDGRVSLVHGDYRIDNLLFDQSGQHILAVLDWELSTLGHPFADLAYQCALWRLPPDAALAGLAGIDRTRLGLPSDDEYRDQYCEHMNVSDIPNWNFYLVFSLFRMAAIVQGVKKRALDGNASASKDYALRVGSLAVPLANEAATLL